MYTLKDISSGANFAADTTLKQRRFNMNRQCFNVVCLLGSLLLMKSLNKSTPIFYL